MGLLGRERRPPGWAGLRHREHCRPAPAQRLHAGETQLHYYFAGSSSDGVKRAIDAAAADGVDVINMSLWVASQSCATTIDPSGINAALSGALNAGAMPSSCAGNSGGSGCTIWYPAVRTETRSVNALQSDNETAAYGNLGIASFASRGTMPIRRFDGLEVTAPGVDLVAPGIFTLSFTGGTNTYQDPTSSIQGCSFATPVVTAAAGLLRNAFGRMGWTTTDAKALMVNMLVMGDGFDADNPGTELRNTISNRSGTGRLRLQRAQSDSMAGPWGWGWRAFTINEGETVRWTVWDAGPEPAEVRQWKWAVTWSEPDMNNVADIDFSVIDTCPPGGGEATITGDAGYGLRSRFNLLQGDISGRCLVMEARGFRVPAGGRVVYSADYFHSGDPATH